MNYIIRDASVLTGEKNLEHLYTLQDFPVFIGCTDQPQANDLYADMSFAICRDTGVIQLDKVLPLDLVYSGYHSEALGGVWDEHHRMFLDFLHRYSPRRILEIGGSSGALAKRYLSTHGEIPWAIVEPNPSPALLAEKNIRVIPTMFDEAFMPPDEVGTVIHSHVFEHMYDPREFLKTIARIVPNGGRHIFSLPNLYQYLKNKQTNCLNFEHTIFLTEPFIEYLLTRFGFAIEEKQYFRDHSIMYATHKERASEHTLLQLPNRYEEYKALFLDYMHFLEEMVADLNERIRNHHGVVYLFGAHAFSQILLRFGLERKRIDSILDNSTLKQGKRLYGTDLSVAAPACIVGKKDAAVVLKAGAYQDEIRLQLQKLNPEVAILE